MIFGIRKVESLGYRMVKKNCRKVQPPEQGAPTSQTTDRQQTDGRPIAYSERNVVRSLKKIQDADGRHPNNLKITISRQRFEQPSDFSVFT